MATFILPNHLGPRNDQVKMIGPEQSPPPEQIALGPDGLCHSLHIDVQDVDAAIPLLEQGRLAQGNVQQGRQEHAQERGMGNREQRPPILRGHLAHGSQGHIEK